MNREELLKDRYEVIAPYPGGIYKEGDLVQPHPFYGFDTFPYPEKYPHLFKKIGWWEKRRIEDLPKYIKTKKTPERVFKVGYFTSYVVMYYGDDGKQKMDNTAIFLPATEAEYLDYLTQNKKS